MNRDCVHRVRASIPNCIVGASKEPDGSYLVKVLLPSYDPQQVVDIQALLLGVAHRIVYLNS